MNKALCKGQVDEAELSSTAPRHLCLCRCNVKKERVLCTLAVAFSSQQKQTPRVRATVRAALPDGWQGTTALCRCTGKELNAFAKAKLKAALRSAGPPGCRPHTQPLCFWCFPSGSESENQDESLASETTANIQTAPTCCALGPQYVFEVLLQGPFGNLHRLPHGTSVPDTRPQREAQQCF